MTMTYKELQDCLKTLTKEQMNQPVSVYSGDVDEAFPVFSTSFNTDAEMGEKLKTVETGNLLLLI